MIADSRLEKHLLNDDLPKRDIKSKKSIEIPSAIEEEGEE